MNSTTLTAAQVTALEIAYSAGIVYSGENPGRSRSKPVGANTIASLNRLGLLNGGQITRAGVAALGR